MVIEHFKSQLGDREKVFLLAVTAYLDALLEYWRSVSGLIQRQEHGNQKVGSELTWEDARRAVFQTGIVLFELDRALRR